MPQGKTLSDLNRSGRLVDIVGRDDDGNSVTVQVWLQKISGPDRQNAAKRADAARARVLAITRDHDSDEWVAMHERTLALGDDPDRLIDELVRAKLALQAPVVHAQLVEGENSPWAKDNYLRTLLDAWEGVGGEPGLKDVWARVQTGDDDVEPADAEEARRVFDELNRFDTDLSAAVDAAREELRAEWEGLDIDRLRELVTEQDCTDAADGKYMTEFVLARVFYATRNAEDHSQRHFTSFAQFNDVDDDIKRQLVQAYGAIEVTSLEGKGSRPAPSSSAPSEPSAEEATSPSSGPTDAAA